MYCLSLLDTERWHDCSFLRLGAESTTSESRNPSLEVPQSEEVILDQESLDCLAFQAFCTEGSTYLGEPETEISTDSPRELPCTGSCFQGNDEQPDPSCNYDNTLTCKMPL